MMATAWVAAGAVLALVLGLLLVLVGQWMRRGRGLGEERTVALDNVMLTSRRLGLTGRPDRLVKADGTIIPEEWKSSSKCTSFRGLGDGQEAPTVRLDPRRRRLFRPPT